MVFPLQALVLLLQLIKRSVVFFFYITNIEMFDLFLIDAAKHFIENIVLYAPVVEIGLPPVVSISVFG